MRNKQNLEYQVKQYQNSNQARQFAKIKAINTNISKQITYLNIFDQFLNQKKHHFIQHFQLEELSILGDQNHVEYRHLLNQMKLYRQRKLEARKKFRFQHSRLKTQNRDIMKESILQKSVQASRFVEINDNWRQKRSLIQLQSESLVQEIADIKNGFIKLKAEKQLVEQQIKLIDKKEIQISFTVCESHNNLDELKGLIKEQKATNQRNFLMYDRKIQQLSLKLQRINEENVLNSKYYKQLITTKNQHKNKSLIGTILMWQNEQSKVKRLPKKIYTKTQIESMLRALFLINKFSDLNFGNIIQHLIKISDPTVHESKSQKDIFLNQKGQEIQIIQLIEKLQAELLTPNECKFLSKTKIVEFYANKGIVIQSDWQPTNLNLKTQQMIAKFVAHFQKLTSWFSRIQKRNLQLSQNFKSLLKIQQQLESQIRNIESSAVQKSINYLQARQQQIEHFHKRLNSACKVIFLFNSNTYDLIRRFQNLNKFFDKIVKSTNRKTYKKTFIQFQEDTEFLKKINKILFKSPECIILDWNNVIKRVKTQSSFISTGEMFEQMPENEIYFETIMKNDLLRMYAEPAMFQKDQSYIDNLKITFNYVIDEEKQIIAKLCNILQDLLLFSKKGIKQFEGYRTQRQQQKKKLALKQDKETHDKLDPLLKLFQQSNLKLDKFFTKDAIKQDADKPSQQQGFCVQSNEFHRRDNFKLIQKLQKLNLKKKGLLPTFPFAVNTSLELQPFAKTVNEISYDQESSRFGSTRNSYRKRQPRLSHQLLSTRHNMLSERRQMQSSRKKDLKDLLKNISNIASENQKYRIRKKLNTQQQTFSASVSRISMNRSHLDLFSKRQQNK